MNETPDTSAYMVAAYIANAVILIGYALSLWRRSVRDRSPRQGE